MANLLSKLFYCVGEEAALVSRVKQAAEWVASKPEGLAVLEEARALHGEPLKIITDSTIYKTGYGDQFGNHVVLANPLVEGHVVFHGQNGERIQLSLERFMSHEFKHAAQPNILVDGEQYTERCLEIAKSCLPAIPTQQYMHRIKALKADESKLRVLLGEIYDTHLGPVAKQTTENILHKTASDPVIRELINKYEVPAIEFENLMMQKYKGEPGCKRTT